MPGSQHSCGCVDVDEGGYGICAPCRILYSMIFTVVFGTSSTTLGTPHWEEQMGTSIRRGQSSGARSDLYGR